MHCESLWYCIVIYWKYLAKITDNIMTLCEYQIWDTRAEPWDGPAPLYDDRTAGLPPAQRLPDILECDGSAALVSCPSFANQIQIRFLQYCFRLRIVSFLTFWKNATVVVSSQFTFWIVSQHHSHKWSSRDFEEVVLNIRYQNKTSHFSCH